MSTREGVNQTQANQGGDCFITDSTAIKVTRIMCYCSLMVVSLLGNSAIIAVVWRDRRMRKTVNFFIVNMCVADLLITMYMPREITVSWSGYAWQIGGTLGLIFCKLAVFIHQTAICSSIFTVVAISLDRFFAVVFPLKRYITQRVCRIIILVIWVSSIFIRVPMLYGLETKYKHGRLGCSLSLDKTFNKGAEKNYYRFTLIGLFAVPLSTIAILYTGILVSLKLRKPPGVDLGSHSARKKRRDVVQKKVLRMVLVVVAVFILCWLLYFIRLILFSYKVSISCNVQFFSLFLANLNSALSPCMYLLLNENYRQGFKDILTRFPLGNLIFPAPPEGAAALTVGSRGMEETSKQAGS